MEAARSSGKKKLVRRASTGCPDVNTVHPHHESIEPQSTSSHESPNLLVMPKTRPAASGYARLAQAEEEERSHGFLDDSDDDEDPYTTPAALSTSTHRYAPIQPQPQSQMNASGASSPTGHRKRPSTGRRRMRSNSSGVDIKAINARLERWAEEIASKFKISKVKGKTQEEEKLEIHHTVFQAPEGVRPISADTLSADPFDGDERMTKIQFDDIVESVRVAIEVGVHPKMISQGSSGSYFARNSDGKVVGVFKPKDEEPYASRNPKWTKWIHRNLFPCFFGRACLIPNLSYVSEAAAYVLDSRLRTNLVPYTDIVYLSSKSFYYDFWDRRSYWRGKKPLPAKVGSFQVFLKGFKDANIFLREHPWPDQGSNGYAAEDAPRKKRKKWADVCRTGGAASEDDDEYADRVPTPPVEEEHPARKFSWTDNIKQRFREELEKLVILDYIMRNTDRGLDNWMIKIDWHTEDVSIVFDPPKLNGHVDQTPAPRPISVNPDRPLSGDLNPYRRQENMVAVSRTGTPSNSHDVVEPSISIGAIDNSLSWPWKHPDAWRSFPFGWLFLPVSLIGQPFSKKTRDHFLPLLTSTAWWSETQLALRQVFAQDSDFKESMFARQIAVMKGQAWNVVETLKQRDHGPLELTRRTRVCVWDDLVDVPIAIPLRAPSADMQRHRINIRGADEQEEEMDISAANASEPTLQHDLLSFGSPTSELPNPNRFSLSREQSSADLGHIREETSPGTPRPDLNAFDHVGATSPSAAKESLSHSAHLPRPHVHTRSKTRSSFEGSRRRGNSGGQRRHFSFSTRYGSTAYLYDGDVEEGDLGYAAAEGMEGNQRKVIVERLETVKSKNPVFTWC